VKIRRKKMEEPNNKKEVIFHEYCPKCQYWARGEHEDPCEDCIAQPWNENSHKPIGFKEVE
jgi:hypothetical protein